MDNGTLPLSLLRKEMTVALEKETFHYRGNSSDFLLRFGASGLSQIFQGASWQERRFKTDVDDDRTFEAEMVTRDENGTFQFFYGNNIYFLNQKETSQFYEKIPMQVVGEEIIGRERENGYFATKLKVVNLMTNETIEIISQDWNAMPGQGIVVRARVFNLSPGLCPFTSRILTFAGERSDRTNVKIRLVDGQSPVLFVIKIMNGLL